MRINNGVGGVVDDSSALVEELKANWIWISDWIDSSEHNTAGRIVRFTHKFNLIAHPEAAVIHCSADTRYKLLVNGVRVAVGPARSSTMIWYFDTVDIARHLRIGENTIEFVVLRYFAWSRAAMPFERTSFPGLTVVGRIETADKSIDLRSRIGWQAQTDKSIEFPTGLIDDVFLHISERVKPVSLEPVVTPKPYGLTTLNGDLLPWRLSPRAIPLPEESHVSIVKVRVCDSSISPDQWLNSLSQDAVMSLPAGSSHTIEMQAEVHSTAFVQWTFEAHRQCKISFKAMYSEGYELEPRHYPFFRTKADRLDADNGRIIGPFDLVELDISGPSRVVYEPFWFRTFRVIRLEITIGQEPVNFASFCAKQVNYPLAVRASWGESEDAVSKQIWDVSIRTMRNCMFDGYSDCPFYEQLQYSCDSRSVGLFHYLLSGDDRLMRQAITNFAASATPEGLTQSRFPSHVRQIIAGFSLYWILAVCDHHLFFGDTHYARSLLPQIDGVFNFFETHVNSLGLIGGLPNDVWQYVDWVAAWGATEEHPDKGVPVSGRKNNVHTYFSLLYAHVLQEAARLLHDVGRPALSDEYDTRAKSVIAAVKTHCYDGRFFTDSTADVADKTAYSQHCQVFAVLAGAADRKDSARLLKESFAASHFSKCSYMMKFYAFRAFAIAGDELYESKWFEMWEPYRDMLKNNLTTWEEDDVRQRSDCHAWGSVPIYEYCTELAGVHCAGPGWSKLLFTPRLHLSSGIKVKISLGKDNLASVSWNTDKEGRKRIHLSLERAVEVTTRLPGEEPQSCGVTDRVSYIF